MFYKIRVLKNFYKIHRKIPVPESFFLVKLHACTSSNFIKKAKVKLFFCEFCGILKNNFFYRTTPTNNNAKNIPLNSFMTEAVMKELTVILIEAV